MDPQKALEMTRPKCVSDDEVDLFLNKVDAVRAIDLSMQLFLHRIQSFIA